MTHAWKTLFAGMWMLVANLGLAQDSTLKTIPVDFPAFVFSPANWTGDTGREGKIYRQSWYPGAYFRTTWTTTSTEPTAELLFDISTYGEQIKTIPEITYCIDGVWVAGVKCAERIKIEKLQGAGSHTLTVYFKTSEQKDRWGSDKTSGLNIVRITGLAVDAGSKPTPSAPAKKWALIVGDSITEGSAADFGKSDNLAAWSHLVGTGLQSIGYEYGISACGYCGWLRPGDKGGDVPPYYALTKSPNGVGFVNDDARSRWNKIDASHSLLDTAGRLSAYGKTQQEPTLIFINLATNDALSRVNPEELQASITQSLQALQKAAPTAVIFVIVPFGQYGVKELNAGIQTCLAANPANRKIHVIDLGEPAAKALAANGYWSGLHPNLRGHATFAAQILAKILPLVPVK